MKTYSAKELSEIIANHRKWLKSEAGGVRANLSYANLRSANLSYANLRSADLSYANLRSADLSYADLRSANLSYADLSYANLSYADLRYAAGELKYLKSIFLETYPITYTAESMQIGCERHAIEKWKAFTDVEIIKMDGKKALVFWTKYKTFIFQAIELSPALPTGFVETTKPDIA